MDDMTIFNLQLLADGDGGGETAPGDTAAVAGQQALLALGVPADKLRKRAKNAPAAVPEGMFAATPAKATAAKPSWDELMADPDYNGKMQSIVRSRVKKSRDAESALGALTPSLELLARQYGLDGESVDYSTLGDAIARDTRFQSQNAGDMPAAEAEKTAQTRSEASGAVRAHVAELTRQGEKLRETFPGFDLAREMKNPTFLRLTAPGTGVSVEDAYFAVHREELQRMAMQVTAQKAVAKLANSIQAGALRPQEAGTGAQAPSTISFDYRNASPEQRAAIKKRIRDAAARGEKLYPGGRTTP